MVGSVFDRHRGIVLRQGWRPVFAGLARRLLRVRAVRADRLPPRVIPAGAALDPARAP